MPNFSKTVIYKICCNDATITDIYIGHTTDLIMRRYHHKHNCNKDKNPYYNFKIYKFIRENGGWNNWTLIQIEEYPCENVNEARARERYWIEELKPSLNSDIPNRTHKEYCQDEKEKIDAIKKIYAERNKKEITKKSKERYEKNREKVLELAKEYRKQHKNEITVKAKEKIRCDICDCNIRRSNISKHNKTLKHLYLSKLKLEDGSNHE